MLQSGKLMKGADSIGRPYEFDYFPLFYCNCNNNFTCNFFYGYKKAQARYDYSINYS